MKSYQLAIGSWQLALFCTILMLAACSKEKETLNLPDNYAYFPLEVGRYWVYEVDSTIFLNKTSRDTSKTWVKEQIVDYFIDNVGDTIYRVDQYERKDTTQPWTIRRVVSLSRNENKAVRTEDNIPLIKVVFPLRHADNWNSTALTEPTLAITVGDQPIKIFDFWGSRAKIDSIGQPITVGKLQFEETAKVTYIERKEIQTLWRVATEIYAKNVGLVKREWQILDGQCDTLICDNNRWKKIANKGFILSQQLIDHN